MSGRQSHPCVHKVGAQPIVLQAMVRIIIIELDAGARGEGAQGQAVGAVPSRHFATAGAGAWAAMQSGQDRQGCPQALAAAARTSA